MLSLITVSDTFQHFQVPIAEYIHRLSRDISIVHIPPEKSTDMRVIIKKETEKIIQVLKKKYGKKK
jgi:23S rRNA pseudoU1915 N3-methylase RlmH